MLNKHKVGLNKKAKNILKWTAIEPKTLPNNAGVSLGQIKACKRLNKNRTKTKFKSKQGERTNNTSSFVYSVRVVGRVDWFVGGW